MSDELICVVAICKDCREAVIYKYTKISNQSGNQGNPIAPIGSVIGSGSPLIVTTGIPISGLMGHWNVKPDVEWCSCGSDEPRHLCKVTNEELPGMEDKCVECEYRFSCASSRIEVVYNGIK